MSPFLGSPISTTQSQLSNPLGKELTCWLVNLVCQQPMKLSSKPQQQFAYASMHGKSTLDERTTEQLIEYAKQKLRTPQMPHFMRVTVYLRFCCLAIQKSLSEEHQAIVSNFYHDLLQWLWECEPNWWEQCFITDTNKIVSQNTQIQNLLQPLEDFVSKFSEA